MFTDDIDEEYEEYLSELTSQGLERILKEPETLTNESLKIKRTIEKEVFENYKSFIQTNVCIHSLREHMDNIFSHLSSFSTSLPSLSSSCLLFVEKSKEIENERIRNKMTLGRHTQILELLEIPQLMETCVRNSYYEEALLLQQFSLQISRRYPHIPLIQNIAEDVSRSSDIMINQLHSKLKGSIQVTVCLRVIGYLRQLDLYSESQLRISFLKSRDFYLLSQIDQISTQNAYTYLSKYIDLTRSNLFDIITQYRAIFSDNSLTSSSSSSSDLKQSFSNSNAANSSINAKNQFVESEILLSWMTNKMANLIEQLENHLPKIHDGSSIFNLLDQSMYLGLSLSRVGLDFRGLLPPIFENHIFSLFSKAISSSTSQFIDDIKSQKISQFSSKISNPLLERSGEKFAASTALLDVLPLAQLTNSYLTAFNDLRLCAPVTLLPRFISEIENSFSQIAFGLKAHKAIIKSSEEESFTNLIKKAYEIFFPYIERCFNHLFHSSNSSLIDINPFVEILQSI